MIKCPKCGSTDIVTERRPDGNSTCQKCGHEGKTAKFVGPTTAEKLLWLVENGLEIYTVLDGETRMIDRKELYFCAKNGKSRTSKVDENQPLSTAVDKVYEFAKEQKQ